MEVKCLADQIENLVTQGLGFSNDISRTGFYRGMDFSKFFPEYGDSTELDLQIHLGEMQNRTAKDPWVQLSSLADVARLKKLKFDKCSLVHIAKTADEIAKSLEVSGNKNFGSLGLQPVYV